LFFFVLFNNSFSGLSPKIIRSITRRIDKKGIRGLQYLQNKKKNQSHVSPKLAGGAGAITTTFSPLITESGTLTDILLPPRSTCRICPLTASGGINRK
jgi:hypothetical protein